MTSSFSVCIQTPSPHIIFQVPPPPPVRVNGETNCFATKKMSYFLYPAFTYYIMPSFVIFCPCPPPPLPPPLPAHRVMTSFLNDPSSNCDFSNVMMCWA